MKLVLEAQIKILNPYCINSSLKKQGTPYKVQQKI